MAAFVKLRTDRQWEYWLSLALGCLVALSPWIVEQGTGQRAIVLNAMVAGLAIAFIAGMEIDALRTWEELVALALGVWTMASPWIFGYAALGKLTVLQLAAGGLVAALAAREWWQDRRRAKD